MVKSLLISGAYFPPQTGGISRMMEEICVRLGSANVSCLTGVPGARVQSGLRTYRRPLAFSETAAWRVPALAGSLLEIYARERPHVVQLATCQDGNLGLALERWLGIPFVVYAHGNEILEALNSDWSKPRMALHRASAVLANSRFTADLAMQAGARPEAIEIIPLGCDAQRFSPASVDANTRKRLIGDRAPAPVILTVGNLVERKGHDMVIRAMPAVLRRVPGAIYLIAGSGPYRSQLEHLAVSLGVGSQVVFAGRIADDDLPSLYRLCDVFAMPSRARTDCNDVEGFGIVYLEAGAAGKPVLAGRSGGVEDAVLDGETGILVDPLSEEDVAGSLIRLLTDGELRDRFGARARRRVEDEYNWPVTGSRVGAILERVVRDAPRRGRKPDA